MADVFSRTLVLTSGVKAEVPGNLFYGDLPPRLELFVLSGVSNDFSSVEFIQGSFIDSGSLILGGSSPSGIFQVVDLSNNTVSGVVQPPSLKSNNITDISN